MRTLSLVSLVEGYAIDQLLAHYLACGYRLHPLRPGPRMPILTGRPECVSRDEAERLKATTDPAVKELLALLQAGYHRRGRASRLELAGDMFKPVSVEVFGPKALASINGPPPALTSRCIIVPMLRDDADSLKPKQRILSEQVQPIRDRSVLVDTTRYRQDKRQSECSYHRVHQ